MKAFLTLSLIAVAAVGAARADDAARVKVALALAAKPAAACDCGPPCDCGPACRCPTVAASNSDKVKVALALAANSCGACKFDEQECRAEAVAANKPLVLFVGETCGKLGTVARDAGAIACVVSSYKADSLADTPRAVVLSPDGTGAFYKGESIIKPTESEVLSAIKAATPVPLPPAKATGRPLDWETGFRLEWGDLTPAAQARIKAMARGEASSPTPLPAPTPVAAASDLADHLVREHGYTRQQVAAMTPAQQQDAHNRAHGAPSVQQQIRQQVPGQWTVPAQPWGFPAPVPVPQRMPQQCGPFGCGFQAGMGFGGGNGMYGGIQMGRTCGPNGCR